MNPDTEPDRNRDPVGPLTYRIVVLVWIVFIVVVVLAIAISAL
jgi:hypothetical protein